MKLEKKAEIVGGQDGAIWNGYLFRFDGTEKCRVYDLEKTEGSSCAPAFEFDLDKNDLIIPHSNAVSFGKEYYEKDDEFPLLYTNIYNNCADRDDRMEGVCLVYRIMRDGDTFSSELVQLIEIGFVNDREYWRSSNGTNDVRPYGNFVVDRESGVYFAFTMRDGDNCTEYFSFDLPLSQDGEVDSAYGVKRVKLDISDIKSRFSCEYHRYIQGATLHNGIIYSLEGFACSEENPPMLRLIDVEKKKQAAEYNLYALGYKEEPELIDFADDVCYYSDGDGNLYILNFENELSK